VCSGRIYLPPEIDAQIDQRWVNRATQRLDGDVRKLGLSDRQTEVLRLILQGMSNKLIGRQLKLAEGTVKVHVSAVLRALGVRNRTQAVLAANRLGLRLPE
jgi:DNA-binding NarL/FixJ family response regulator